MSTSVFSSAAEKHLTDATMLFGENRFDNCFYLSGYVAECSLKVLLEFDGMPGQKELGHELAPMAGSVLALAYSLSPSRRRYGPDNLPALEPLLRDWKPERRYESEGTITRDGADAGLKAAYAVYEKILVAMKLDGNL